MKGFYCECIRFKLLSEDSELVNVSGSIRSGGLDFECRGLYLELTLWVPMFVQCTKDFGAKICSK